MKKLLLILLACMPLFAAAREKNDNSDPKYLAGAVTMNNDGKIAFTKEIKAPSLSKEAIFKQMLDWAQKRFHDEGDLQSRVVYTDEEKGEIAVAAEEYMVFSSSALSLDRTRVYYQLFMHIGQGDCRLEMTRIRYWYDENRNGGERYTAEEWITDEMALNKKRTKLAPICGKFRRETIDLKDELFDAASASLGVQALSVQASVPAAVVQPAAAVATAATAATAMTGGELKEVAFEQLPAGMDALVTGGRITLTANDEEIELKAADWGGFGKLFTKNVVYTLVDRSRIAVSAVMEHCEAYTLSIYAAGQTEPWLVIDCKKAMAQKLDAEGLKSLNQQADASKEYTLYVGEISRIRMCGASGF